MKENNITHCSKNSIKRLDSGRNKVWTKKDTATLILLFMMLFAILGMVFTPLFILDKTGVISNDVIVASADTNYDLFYPYEKSEIESFGDSCLTFSLPFLVADLHQNTDSSSIYDYFYELNNFETFYTEHFYGYLEEQILIIPYLYYFNDNVILNFNSYGQYGNYDCGYLFIGNYSLDSGGNRVFNTEKNCSELLTYNDFLYYGCLMGYYGSYYELFYSFYSDNDFNFSLLSTIKVDYIYKEMTNNVSYIDSSGNLAFGSFLDSTCVYTITDSNNNVFKMCFCAYPTYNSFSSYNYAIINADNSNSYYNSIFDKGYIKGSIDKLTYGIEQYNLGYNIGIAGAENGSIYSLMSGVGDGVVSIITGLFSFDIPSPSGGTASMLNFVKALMSILLVIFIIKLLLGGGSS